MNLILSLKSEFDRSVTTVIRSQSQPFKYIFDVPRLITIKSGFQNQKFRVVYLVIHLEAMSICIKSSVVLLVTLNKTIHIHVFGNKICQFCGLV